MSLTPDQIERRKNLIGSTDAAEIMTGGGVRVTLQKRGEIPVPDLSDVDAVQLGHALEPRIIDSYEAETGLSVVRSPDTIYHPEHEWFGVHLDGYVPLRNGRMMPGRDPVDTVVEAKGLIVFSRKYFGEPGTDEVPVAKYWQCQAHMAASESMSAHLPVCFVDATALRSYILGKPLPIKIYIVQRNDELIDIMMQRCAEVWECVQGTALPEPVVAGDAELLYRTSVGTTIEATHNIALTHRLLMAARADVKAAEKAVEGYEQKIKEFMGENAFLAQGGTVLCSWKNDASSTRTDSAALKAQYPDIWAAVQRPYPGPRKFLPKAIK